MTVRMTPLARGYAGGLDVNLRAVAEQEHGEDGHGAALPQVGGEGAVAADGDEAGSPGVERGAQQQRYDHQAAGEFLNSL